MVRTMASPRPVPGDGPLDGVGRPEEPAEQLLLITFRNADPRVGDGEHGLRSLGRRADPDPPAFGGEFHGVGQQAHQQPVELAGIAADDQPLAGVVAVQRQPFGGRGGLERRHRRADDVRHGVPMRGIRLACPGRRIGPGDSDRQQRKS
jgi:hypothetical protein